MLKLYIFTGLLLLGAQGCFGSDAGAKLTRSTSGTFYLDGVAVTAHDAARTAPKPLAVRLDGFVPVLDLDGATHEISTEEFTTIQDTNKLMKLAATHMTLSGTGSYPELTAAQNTLARSLTASELTAKQALITKQRRVIASAKSVLAMKDLTPTQISNLTRQIETAEKAIKRAEPKSRCLVM